MLIYFVSPFLLYLSSKVFSVELPVTVSLVGYIRGTFQAPLASQTRAVVKRRNAMEKATPALLNRVEHLPQSPTPSGPAVPRLYNKR